MTNWTYYPISTLPAALDLVWCRFPFEEVPNQPALKPRPALIRATAIAEGNLPEVQVIFGTSNLKMASRPMDFFVTNYADIYEAGLPQATRFDMDKCLWLPWAEEFFTARRGYASPILGHLSERSQEYLKYVIAMRLKSVPGI